ncbi:MAG: carbamoyltransferase HypF [Deltaproteobacteria bacterium]|nr:carbamoyltransferase HypF [Deltaproteobacteria bacterium]
MTTGRRIAITGTVQGVGFRPWIYRLARELGVAGQVHNDARGVVIEAFAPERVLETFVGRIGREAPGRVRDLFWDPIERDPVTPEFTIDTSLAEGAVALSIPPDLTTCDDCLAEMRDPANRRYRYPFTNCTFCGPRFTIALDLPYDRPATTMAGFPLCPDCLAEYRDPADRRFHAQPIACPVCGPKLRLTPPGSGDALDDAAALLRDGAIVAIKGLGGFHLACDATSPEAVAELRARKHRDRKPFAIMVADLAAARRIAILDDAAAALLTGPDRPITLLERRYDAGLAPEVSPETPLVGLFLPYTPLHHLLLAAVGRPLVMTSGNLSDEPIVVDDDDDRLTPLCDAVLGHDRPIATRCDDSVARIIAGAPMILRRSRGFVPRPIALRHRVLHPVLAVGAHLKNTFCLAHGDSAYLGPHVGDLDTVLASEFFAEAIERMERLVHVRPEIVVHDLHPDYHSTRYALERGGVTHVGAQHHHAHVAAVIAEHGLAGPVLGLAWDGTGLGSDGASWGGELLLASDGGFERLATLRPIALPGGDAAVRDVWRIALALLDDAYDGDAPLDRLALFDTIAPGDVRVTRQMIAKDINSPRVHGIGRLFDGIGALGLRHHRSHHEGQVAMAWNHAADGPGTYPIAIDRTGAIAQLDHRPLVRAVVGDLLAGVNPAVIAARFHRALVHGGAALVRDAIAKVGVHPIALAGGCFQNPLLTEGLCAELRDLEVHVPRAVPPGDGGLALGQVLIGATVTKGSAAACV